jgi:transcriptional regulator with XRE-family HTH domain
MRINDRLRAIRESKRLSQADMAKRLGLSMPYISSVENSYTVPSVQLLEEWAQALSVSFCQLFYDGEKPPLLPNLPGRLTSDEIASPRQK